MITHRVYKNRMINSEIQAIIITEDDSMLVWWKADVISYCSPDETSVSSQCPSAWQTASLPGGLPYPTSDF